jgi:hypothetical protein
MRPTSRSTTVLLAAVAAALTLTACGSPESKTAESFVAAAIVGEPTIDFVSIDGYLNQDGELQSNRAGCEVTGSSPVEGTGNPVAPQRVELDCPDGTRFVIVNLNADGLVYSFDW